MVHRPRLCLPSSAGICNHHQPESFFEVGTALGHTMKAPPRHLIGAAGKIVEVKFSQLAAKLVGWLAAHALCLRWLAKLIAVEPQAARDDRRVMPTCT